jgi:glycosyltransferase involved in cell wall biosynthesis
VIKLLPGVSVVLCTRNGQARIVRCLEHLLRLQLPDGNLPVEILLVDNGSTDNTVEIARSKSALFNSHPLRILEEHRKGVTFARETGILSAKYQALIFCDDDNLLDSEYARIAWMVLQDNPTVAIVGGNSIAESDAPFPVWFNELSGQYAVQYFNYSGPIQSDTNHWTAGMVARTEVLQRLIRSGFRPIGSTGLPGFSGSCGEDTEICLAVRHWNWELYYEGKLSFTHVISPDRLNRQFLIDQAKNFGAASVAHDAKRLMNQRDWRNIVRLNIFYQLTRALLSLFAALPGLILEDPSSHALSAWHARFGRIRALWLNRAVYRKLVSAYRDWYLLHTPPDSKQQWLG